MLVNELEPAAAPRPDVGVYKLIVQPWPGASVVFSNIVSCDGVFVPWGLAPPLCAGRCALPYPVRGSVVCIKGHTL